MVRPLDSDDFRAHRHILEPDDFAIGPEGPEPPPSDLISQRTWHSIVDLPDDVSIRTSNDHGLLISKLWGSWSDWISLVGALQELASKPAQSPVCTVALNAIDEFQAGIYNSLVGFYRQAYSGLRNVVEHSVIGLYFKLSGDEPKFEDWLRGLKEVPFGQAADSVATHQHVAAMEATLRNALGEDLFGQRKPSYEGGWARRIYHLLSNYTHARPTFTNADMWESNGPVYRLWAFLKWAGMFADVFIFAMVSAKLAKPRLHRLGNGSTKTIFDLASELKDLDLPKAESTAVLHAAFNYLKGNP